MDSAVKMAKIEFINTFLAERLLAVAGEIFQVVKATLNEYQEEMERTKQENHYLKRMLTEKRNADEREDQIDPDVSQELSDFSPSPLESKPSIIQVKVEFSTLQQDTEPDNDAMPAPSISSYPTVDKGPPNHFSTRTTSREREDEGVFAGPGVPVKLEQCNNAEHVTANLSVDRHATSPSIPCQMPSDSYSPAETHLLGQTEPVVYCEHCGKPFSSRYHLKRHITVHQKEKPRPFRCDLCGKCYSYAQVLEVHRRTHTGERPYRCRFCGRLFNQRGHLSDHERIHTGEKPFSCSFCGKRFIQSGQVRKHIRNSHPAQQQ